jgi:anthranilate phosphoribosyltransferase
MAANEETADEVAGFAKAMRELLTPVDVASEGTVSGAASGLPDSSGPIVDIVGTGGDGHNTLNISTTAAVVAAACGARVAKHGSVSVSSMSGSADVLQRLGIEMLPKAGVEHCLSHCGIGFMFAPLFHPAMKHVVPIRRALGVRTVFNILGPLLNPASTKRMMLGVYSTKVLETYGSALASLGVVEHALVVHCCGLDELAPLGEADAIEVRGSVATRINIDTLAIAGPRCAISDLRGGSPEENAASIRDLLAGGDDAATGPVGRTVALNAGAALYVSGHSATIAQGFAAAQESIRAGHGAAALARWSKVCADAKTAV